MDHAWDRLALGYWRNVLKCKQKILLLRDHERYWFSFHLPPSRTKPIAVLLVE